MDVEEASFYVRRHALHPDMTRKIQQNFNKNQHALYPYRKSEVRYASIPPGITKFSTQPIFRGILPDILCIGLVSHAAASGTYNKNPFNFQHFNLSKLTVTLDDHPVVYRAIECDYEKKKYLMGYNTLLKSSTGMDGNYITADEYLQGNTVYVLDLASARPDEFHTDKVGEIKIHIGFSQQTPEVVNLIVLAQLQALFQVDKNGNVTVEERDI